METAVALEAPADFLNDLKSRTSRSDIEWSEPIVISSEADALESPIGGEEVRQVLEMTIILFKTGAAALAFAKAAYELAHLRKTDVATVKDPSTGKPKGTITNSSSDTEVRDLITR